MRTRPAAVLLISLGLFGGGTAAAQTTSTSTSTSSSTTSSTSSSTTTSTPTTSTTSTTIANPCAGQVCTAEPPSAFLSGANGEVRLDSGGYCWQGLPDAQGRSTATCADVFLRDPDALLVVKAGETLTLRFGAGRPSEVLVRRGLLIEPNDQPVTLAPTNPTHFRADLPAGVHVVSFSTRWPQGDATYRVRLDVRSATTPPPATPKKDLIALTG